MGKVYTFVIDVFGERVIYESSPDELEMQQAFYENMRPAFEAMREICLPNNDNATGPNVTRGYVNDLDSAGSGC